MSTPPSPNDLTRQQLDELDALLQRMLSLPLASPADSPPPSAPLPPLPDAVSAPAASSWRADHGAPTKLPYLTAEPEPAPTVVAEPTWGPDPLARYGSTPPTARLFGPPTPDTGVPPVAETPYEYSLPIPGTGTVRGVDAPALPAGFRSLLNEPPADTPASPDPVPLTPASSTPPPAEPERPGIPLPLWPVFAVNWVLEALLGLLGPVGVLLTHPAIKHVLGLAGVLLLVAAGLWTARGLGWIVLPGVR